MAGKRGNDEVSKLVGLSMKHVKRLMKSSPEVENISKEAVFLVTKATEMFVHFLAQSAYNIAKDAKELHYDDLAEIVQTYEVLSFLREIIPRTITFAQYKEIMKAKGKPIEYETSDDENSDDVNDSAICMEDAEEEEEVDEEEDDGEDEAEEEECEEQDPTNGESDISDEQDR